MITITKASKTGITDASVATQQWRGAVILACFAALTRRSFAGNFDVLEKHHAYIQFLFPTRDLPERNLCAQQLQLHEIEWLRSDADAQRRLRQAVDMMLEFFGFELIDGDDEHAALKCQPLAEPRRALKNLNDSHHNSLRITRMLKSLGELGQERLKAPIVRALAREVLKTKRLKKLERSLTNFWIATLRDDDEREALEQFVQQMKQQQK